MAGAGRAQVLFDLRPNEDFAGEHLERNPGHAAVQAQPSMSEHEANTTIVEYASTGMVHTQARRLTCLPHPRPLP